MDGNPHDPAESASRRRHDPAHLSALSNLYRRAQEGKVVLPGYNPVAALMEKPAGPRREARWIEIHDAALLLEAARQLRPLGGTSVDADAMARVGQGWAVGRYASRRAAGRAYGVSDVVVGRILRGEQLVTPPVNDATHAHVLVALVLLTGCRFREVAGLELDECPSTGRPSPSGRTAARAQDPHVAPGDPALAPARGDSSRVGVRPPARARRGAAAALLVVPRGRAAVPRHSPAARSRGEAGVTRRRRAPLEGLPAHLLCGSAADA
jgi:hypothetical protein